MRALVLVLVAMATRPASAQQAAMVVRPADVAIYPLTLADTANAGLRVLRDSCAGLMARRLTAERLVVMRRPVPLRELRRAKTARFAITGTLAVEEGKYSTELSLVDVASNEELRSYFSGPDSLACRVPEAAAARIASVIREASKPATTRRRR